MNELMLNKFLEKAEKLDREDRLSEFRKEFLIPEKNGKKVIYFCGNSLGLQPLKVKENLETELNDWAKLGVEGHVKAKNPWMFYHKNFNSPLAKLTGAKEHEVAAMNSLTANLHFLMVSFYRPETKRFKILIEDKAFPSDHYAVESQIRFHGHDPADALIIVRPPKGMTYIPDDVIIDTIEQHKDELVLVMLSGINYYTGQLFDMKSITQKAHSIGAFAGFDLAHAIGNVPLQLHDWNVDFAVWCTYKYLNSGPGSVGGAYVHEKHAAEQNIPRFNGWWGYKENERFEMNSNFKPENGMAAWQLSNLPVLSMAAHKAALDLFDKAGIQNVRDKSIKLTAFIESCLNEIIQNNQWEKNMQLITPADPEKRGAQLSILINYKGNELFNALKNAGIITDWRKPDVIRIAPAPLYNTYSEAYEFVRIVEAEYLKLQ